MEKSLLSHYCSQQMLPIGELIIGLKNPKIIILKIHEIIGYRLFQFLDCQQLLEVLLQFSAY